MYSGWKYYLMFSSISLHSSNYKCCEKWHRFYANKEKHIETQHWRIYVVWWCAYVHGWVKLSLSFEKNKVTKLPWCFPLTTQILWFQYETLKWESQCFMKSTSNTYNAFKTLYIVPTLQLGTAVQSQLSNDQSS